LKKSIEMSIYIEVYKKENDEKDLSTYTTFTFSLDMRVIDMRDEIMWKMYDSCKERKEHDEYYLEIENITDRLYKDFGKLFFDFGLLAKTIDNYPLSKMTSDGRVFQFQVYRMKKSELRDYVKVKRIYELTAEEKKQFENKAVAKKIVPAWTMEEEKEEPLQINLTEEDKKEIENMYSPYVKKKTYDEW
jgi:hypothetical protein